MNTSTPWTPRKVRIALAQFSMSAEPETNLDIAIDYIREAASKGVQLVCLPELFRSPYFCRSGSSERDYVEALPGKVGEALVLEAKRLKIAIVAGSVYELDSGGKRFNTSLVIAGDGTILGTYRKVHIPHDPAFYECNYFEPGDLGFKVFDLGFAKVGVLICYDQWFPEAARAVALMGAETICYPTAIGNLDGNTSPEGDWHLAWESVQRGHAIANSVVVACVNRVGVEGKSHFWGGSFVCDAFGRLLVKGGVASGLFIADVDLGHSKFTRDDWRFFESRRPEMYTALSAKS